MSKQQIIQAIQQHNRSVNEDFLVRFDEKTLRHYLERLANVLGHRGPTSVWVRPGDTPAIVGRAC